MFNLSSESVVPLSQFLNRYEDEVGLTENLNIIPDVFNFGMADALDDNVLTAGFEPPTPQPGLAPAIPANNLQTATDATPELPEESEDLPIFEQYVVEPADVSRSRARTATTRTAGEDLPSTITTTTSATTKRPTPTAHSRPTSKKVKKLKMNTGADGEVTISEQQTVASLGRLVQNLMNQLERRSSPTTAAGATFTSLNNNQHISSVPRVESTASKVKTGRTVDVTSQSSLAAASTSTAGRVEKRKNSTAVSLPAPFNKSQLNKLNRSLDTLKRNLDEYTSRRQ